MSENNNHLVLVFVPALVVILNAAEKAKGSPLEENEVLSIRDKAVCMAVTISAAKAMDEKRGYADLVPEAIWEDWKAFRSQVEG